MTHRTLAFTLNYTPSGEKDRLYTIYTNDFGKLKLLAKGGREIKSKLVAHLEPPVLVDCLVARGLAIDRLAGAVAIRDFGKIRASSAHRIAALEALRLVDWLTPYEASDRAIFDLLSNFFIYLEANDVSKDIVWLFAKKLLAITGHENKEVKTPEAIGLAISEIVGKAYTPRAIAF